MRSRAVHGRATRQARSARLEKRAGMESIFFKKIKFGRVVPARQDKWAGSDTKKIPAGIPARPLSLIYIKFLIINYIKLPKRKKKEKNKKGSKEPPLLMF